MSTKRGSTRRASTGSRQRPSAMVKGRSSMPLRSSDDAAGLGRERRQLDVRDGDLQRDRRGGRDEAGDRARAAKATSASEARARLARLRGTSGRGGERAAARALPARLQPLPRKGGGRRGSSSAMSRSPQRADHLDLAGRRAGAPLGPVHVLDQRRRVDEDARRHGAHDVGELELRRAAGRQVERRDEAVGAGLGMRRVVDDSASRAPPRRRSPSMFGFSISKPAGIGSTSTSRAPWSPSSSRRARRRSGRSASTVAMSTGSPSSV